MPEAFAVLGVFVVCVFAYVAAWLRSRDPSLQNAVEDAHRLRHHAAWLQDRLERAQREQWGPEMTGLIATELKATNAQLAALSSTR